MYSFLNKYGQTAAFALGALITVIFFIQVNAGISTFDGLSKEEQLNSGIFSFGLGASVLLSILCAIAIVGFGFYYLITHPKSLMRTVVPVLVLAGIFVVSYIMAKPAETGAMASLAERFELTDGQEKFISAGLSTTLVLFIGAALAFAISEVRNFFK